MSFAGTCRLRLGRPYYGPQSPVSGGALLSPHPPLNPCDSQLSRAMRHFGKSVTEVGATH